MPPEVVSQEPSEMTGTRNSLAPSWRYFKTTSSKSAKSRSRSPLE
jgi:hypothetical protein